MNHEQDAFSFVGVKDRLRMFEQRNQEKTTTSPTKLNRKIDSKNEEILTPKPHTHQNIEINTHTFLKPNQNKPKECKFNIIGIQKDHKPTEHPVSTNSKEPPQILAPPPKLCEVQSSSYLISNSKLNEVKVPLDPNTPPKLSETDTLQDQEQSVKYQSIQKKLGKSDVEEKVPHSIIIDTKELQEQSTPIKTITVEENLEINPPISELISGSNSETQTKTVFSKLSLLSSDKIVHPIPPPPPPPLLSKIHDITPISMMPPLPPPLPVLSISQKKNLEICANMNFQTNEDFTPPIPPPLPITNTSQKRNLEISANTNFQTNDDSIPPLPPPLPSLSKTTKKANILVGWIKNTHDEPVVENSNDSINIKNKNNDVMETKKAPPVVVAPPSLESVMKITERDPSSKLVTNIRDSGASSHHSGDNDEDTYDDDNDDLNNEPWYFNVSREEATALMKDATKKGSYMMRPSENKQYVLMVRTESKEIKKFKVQRCVNGWILGDPSNLKRIHDNLRTLMDYYKSNGIKFGNATIPLKYVVPKD